MIVIATKIFVLVQLKVYIDYLLFAVCNHKYFSSIALLKSQLNTHPPSTLHRTPFSYLLTVSVTAVSNLITNSLHATILFLLLLLHILLTSSFRWSYLWMKCMNCYYNERKYFRRHFGSLSELRCTPYLTRIFPCSRYKQNIRICRRLRSMEAWRLCRRWNKTKHTHAKHSTYEHNHSNTFQNIFWYLHIFTFTQIFTHNPHIALELVDNQLQFSLKLSTNCLASKFYVVFISTWW